MNRGSALHEVYAQVVREARAIKTKITRKSFGERAQAIADQVLNDLRRDAPSLRRKLSAGTSGLSSRLRAALANSAILSGLNHIRRRKMLRCFRYQA